LALHHKSARFSNYDVFSFTPQTGNFGCVVGTPSTPQCFNTFQYYTLPAVTTLDASLAYKFAAHPFGASSFKDAEARLIFTNITSQQKPVSAAANGSGGLTNPYLSLMEPFSVFATVTVSF
jgi:hypothetical protein